MEQGAKTMQIYQAEVVHTFNPSTWETEAGESLSFKDSLVYKESFRTARAAQRNPVSKTSEQEKLYINIKPSLVSQIYNLSNLGGWS